MIASYPGLLTPVFVTCSTNAREGLVTGHVQWCMWMCEGVAHSQKKYKWVCYRSQTPTVEQLSAQHQAVLAMFHGFRKPLYSYTEGMCHSSSCASTQHPGTSLHVISFTRPSPRVSIPSDKHWGEKAWVRGYWNDASFSTTSSCSVPFVCVCQLPCTMISTPIIDGITQYPLRW